MVIDSIITFKRTKLFSPVRNIKSINRFRWNVENYRINFAFTQTWRYNTKLHEPNKRKMGLSAFDQSLLLHGRKVSWHSVFSFFIFLFRSNGKNEHLHENNLRHGYGNYFKSAVLNVTWFQLCSNFFLSNCKARWQRHLKYTLQLKILRT